MCIITSNYFKIYIDKPQDCHKCIRFSLLHNSWVIFMALSVQTSHWHPFMCLYYTATFQNENFYYLQTVYCARRGRASLYSKFIHIPRHMQVESSQSKLTTISFYGRYYMGYSMMKLVICKIYWDLQQSYEKDCSTKAFCLATLRLAYKSSTCWVTTPNVVRIIERFIYIHESQDQERLLQNTH